VNEKKSFTMSKEYGFPEYGIRRLIKQGAFPVIRSGNRCYVSRQVFDEYIKSGGEFYAKVGDA
jgi:hypothetical protein